MAQNRRRFLQSSFLGGLTAVTCYRTANSQVNADCATAVTAVPQAPARALKPSELDESTITDLQRGMKTAKFTARSLAERYLARIEEIDKHGPAINAVIEINPDALANAEQLDKERKDKGPRGPLHGIPVLLKDNIDTADRMATTAGSLALVGARPPKDSFVAERLRRAGALILGKTNLSEWANIRSSSSTSLFSVSRSFPFSRMTVTLSVIQSPISSASRCGFSDPDIPAILENSVCQRRRAASKAPLAAGSLLPVSRL